MTIATETGLTPLKARRLGIDTHDEAVIFMRKDCHVCRSEGFTSHARVRVTSGERSIIATLYQVTSDLLRHSEAGFSEVAWKNLALSEQQAITVSHPRPLDSFSVVRSKVYGHRLNEETLGSVIGDITAGLYLEHSSLLVRDRLLLAPARCR